jgi:hemoglobin/transferrin/lactoferrin receptor protein
LLKTVRVETGVGPADVGPGSLGGSIALETKDARDLLARDQSFGGYGKLQYDSNAHGFSEVLTLATRQEGFEGLLYGSDDSGRNYKDGDGRETLGTAPEMRNLLGKFAWSGRTGSRVEFNSGYLSDELTVIFGDGKLRRRFDCADFAVRRHH